MEININASELTIEFFHCKLDYFFDKTGQIKFPIASNFLAKTEKLQKLLLSLAHLTLGVPARGTEEATLTIVNQTGPRSLYILQGIILIHFFELN